MFLLFQGDSAIPGKFCAVPWCRDARLSNKPDFSHFIEDHAPENSLLWFRQHGLNDPVALEFRVGERAAGDADL